MKIHVLYFAVVRERLASDGEDIELAGGACVSDAMDALAVRHPVIADFRKHLQVALNQESASPEQALSDGDELALIPPVAGGTGQGRLARVVADRPLTLDAVTRAVAGPGMGGLATFSGVVRDHARGQKVERLEYEAYEDMAQKIFVALCEEIETQWPGVRVAVEHRIGALAVGDVAVVIAAAGAHRKEAFEACQAMIDRLKERAPIWKKEFGENGESWVGLGP